MNLEFRGPNTPTFAEIQAEQAMKQSDHERGDKLRAQAEEEERLRDYLRGTGIHYVEAKREAEAITRSAWTMSEEDGERLAELAQAEDTEALTPRSRFERQMDELQARLEAEAKQAARPIEKGDVVQLKAGSPAMLVTVVYPARADGTEIADAGEIPAFTVAGVCWHNEVTGKFETDRLNVEWLKRAQAITFGYLA